MVSLAETSEICCFLHANTRLKPVMYLDQWEFFFVVVEEIQAMHSFSWGGGGAGRQVIASKDNAEVILLNRISFPLL